VEEAAGGSESAECERPTGLQLTGIMGKETGGSTHTKDLVPEGVSRRKDQVVEVI
jgi:hypothetical protein